MRRCVRWLQAVGMILILASLLLLAGAKIQEANARKESKAVAERMTQLLALRGCAVWTDAPMPVMEVDGRDYVCLLEVPGLAVTLPVCDDWEVRHQVGNPCRYWGSCYNGSLIIGGGRMAQMEFCGRLDLGDRILVTDLQGREFPYRVTSILRADELTFQRLKEGEEPLTLFARDGSSRRHIIVKCGISES